MSTVAHHAHNGNTPEKLCTGPCQRVLPATTEYFHRNKGSKDGLCSPCKECARARTRAYYETHREQVKASSKKYVAEHREQAVAYQKRYAAEHKAERAAYKKVYNPAHQQEILARHKQHYAAHKEQFSEYGKRYRAANQVRKSERDRQYREAHTAEKRERDRQYREAHAEELATKQRIYYALHIEEYRASIKRYNQTERGIIAKRTSAHNRRARKKNAPGSHTTEELQQQLKRQKGKCYYCHVKLGKGRDSWNGDHVTPLSRGGSNDIHNLVITCPTCNRKKNDKLPHEWAEGGRLL